MDISYSPDDHVAFRVGNIVTNDLYALFVAMRAGEKVTWYTRLQMIFMATCGPQWEQFSRGPALRFEKVA